jgi:hypothetical protein
MDLSIKPQVLNVEWGLNVQKCIKWGSHGLNVEVENETLSLRGSFNIEVKTRGVVFERATGYRVVGDGRKKYIYIEHMGLEPLEDAVDCPDELELGKLVLNRVNLDFEEYLTIVTSSESLIDYIVVTRRLTCIVISRRREAYFDFTGNTLAVYLL